MRSKEKIRKALRGQEVDEIPLYENFISLENASQVIPEVVTEEHLSIMESDLSASEKNKKLPGLLQKGLEKELKVAKKVGLDALSIAIHPEVKWIKSHQLQTEFGRIYQPNLNLLGYGALSMLRQKKEGSVWLGSTVSKVEDLLELNLDPEGNSRLSMLEKFSDDKVMIIPELLMLQRIWSIFGYGEYIELLTERKSLFKKLMEKWKQYNLKAIKLLSKMGYDVFFYGGDFGSTTGGLYPRKEFKELILPYLKEMVNACHERDSLLILHSCGDINRYLPDIVEAGFDGLHPLEPPWMDFESIKETWGDKICLIGNVDARITLVRGSLKEVKRETKRKIQVGQLKGHILSSSHSIHPGVKFENWMTMLETAQKFGNREWVEKHPVIELPEWEPPLRSETAESWEEVIRQREKNLLDPVDVYLVSRKQKGFPKDVKDKAGIGTVATPNEAGREIVASCLKASGYEIKDMGTITPQNCIEKLKKFEIVLLSFAKNPQAIDQGEIIGRKLRKIKPEIKIMIGGGALNRLLLHLEKRYTEEKARKKIKERFKADGFGTNEIEALRIFEKMMEKRKKKKAEEI